MPTPNIPADFDFLDPDVNLAGLPVAELAELCDAAAHDLLDVTGVDARLLHESLLGGAQQLGGVQARQPSVPLADGAAGGFNDDRVTHSARLEHVS